ncbi:metallophosphoesterase [Gracilimonas sp.]|uniref:metallophosphoesterase n=1 Tax=Gracilimonas sp. TaxID=1974203 RepID=UPI002870F24E|nr:metallophosphoesterase [Gracilimonas sp.]
MLIGLISDTHDHVPNIKKAVSEFKSRKADMVLHAGDYCSPFTIPHFEGLNLKGIFGNNDGDKYLLISKFNEMGAEIAGDFLKVQAGGLIIAVYHGTHAEITDSLCHSGRYDIVVSGHIHEKVNRVIGNTIHVNPGTAHGFEGKASIGFLDTETKEIEFVELN